MMEGRTKECMIGNCYRFEIIPNDPPGLMSWQDGEGLLAPVPIHVRIRAMSVHDNPWLKAL